MPKPCALGSDGPIVMQLGERVREMMKNVKKGEKISVKDLVEAVKEVGRVSLVRPFSNSKLRTDGRTLVKAVRTGKNAVEVGEEVGRPEETGFEWTPRGTLHAHGLFITLTGPELQRRGGGWWFRDEQRGVMALAANVP